MREGLERKAGAGRILAVRDRSVDVGMPMRELAEDLGAALEQITDILGDLTERSVSGDEHAT